MRRIRIGLYGMNGHQIHHALAGNPHGELVAVAAFDLAVLRKELQSKARMPRSYSTLTQLLRDRDVDFVSLCSPRRCDQARDAILCLRAGKHVYAEKPCAMTERELDQIVAVSRQTGMRFHEMAGTGFEQPYLTMRKLVLAGKIGTVVQVLAQKSYPYHERRPQDEDVDGGLLLQVGVHALRMIEHVACVKVRAIEAIDSLLGNPKRGDLRMAVSMMMRLENAGLAAVILKYLHPPSFGQWGNETLRIFGTQVFVEAVDGGTRTRLVLTNRDRGSLKIRDPSVDFLDTYLKSLCGKGKMPLPLVDEIHPTRMVIRARAATMRRGGGRSL
jgi:predicted dehydrogenase